MPELAFVINAPLVAIPIAVLLVDVAFAYCIPAFEGSTEPRNDSIE